MITHAVPITLRGRSATPQSDAQKSKRSAGWNWRVAPHMRRRQEGQAIVFAALVMLFLVPFLLLTVEVAARSLHRQQVEDALQQATRSAAQTFRYDELAENGLTFRGEDELISHARQIFSINLRNLKGLAESPELVAQRVHWEVLPHGGTCTRAEYTAPPGSPTICATLDAPMKSIVGWGNWQTHLITAATLDHIK